MLSLHSKSKRVLVVFENFHGERDFFRHRTASQVSGALLIYSCKEVLLEEQRQENQYLI